MQDSIPTVPFINLEDSSLQQRVLEELKAGDVVLIKGFPEDKELLLKFGFLIGTPMLKPSFDAKSRAMHGVMAYLGDVKFKPEVDTKSRIPTQDSSF
jgi:hypothetical protein